MRCPIVIFVVETGMAGQIFPFSREKLRNEMSRPSCIEAVGCLCKCRFTQPTLAANQFLGMKLAA